MFMKMSIFTLIAICNLFVFVIKAQSESDQANAAFKIHLSSKGLNFISRIAKSMLLDFLKDNSGKTIETRNADKILMKWTNLKIQKYNDDMKSDVVFSPGIGVEYRLRDLNVKLISDYFINAPTTTTTTVNNRPPKGRKNAAVTTSTTSPSGVLTVTMDGISVALLISMLNSAGRLKPFLEDCRCNIDRSSLQITKGNANDFKKYFHDQAINDQAKTFLQQQICIFARTIFVPKIERTFANYPIILKLFDDIYYNYSLTDDPVVNSDHVIYSYAGNAFIRRQNGANDARMPFTAPIVLDENCQDRMMCLYMSNYSIRSLIYIMSKQHRFDYNFTKLDTPTFAKYLRTECPTKDDVCAGTIITSLPKQYPNSNLEIFIRQIPGREQITIKKGVVNMTGEGTITGYVRRANGKREFLFSSNIENYTTMKKPIFHTSNYSVDTKFDANHFQLSNVSSTLSDVNADSLSMLTGFSMDNYVTPDMKRTLGTGLRLPKLIEFDMVNGMASFEDGRIVMAADFCQTQDECKKAEAAAEAEKAKNAKPDYDNLYDG